MNKMKKALLMTLCAVCLVVTTVFGTLAYLTDTDQNVNTFTVGHVQIEMDEYDYDNDVTPGDGNDVQRDKENEYKLIPGQTYTKDPTVTLKKGSEASHIYMTVTVTNLKNLTNVLEDGSYYAEDGVFLLQNLCNWQANSPWQYAGFVELKENDGQYRFVYNETPNALSADKKLEPLFTEITVPGKEFTSDNIDTLKAVQITVDAYAVQAAGFEGTERFNDAWKNTFGNGETYGTLLNNE